MAEIDRCGCEGLLSFFEKAKPSLAMIIVQIGFAGMNILSKIALNQGMSHFVLVSYRHLVATIVTAPFAYFFERKTRPKLTCRLLAEIFFSGLLGITLSQNFYYAGLLYTAATFAAALLNLIPAMTFLMAIIFRMERAGIRTLAGQAKMLGTLVCVGGAMAMTFYKGIKLQLWQSPFHLIDNKENKGKSEDLIKGSLLIVASCFCFSSWFILQTNIAKKFPAEYTSTAIMCFMVTVQSAVAALIFERGHSEVWALGWNVKLLTAVYSGIVASGIAFSLMTWVMKKKGPLFATMFSPLVLIIVAIMGSILLDEKLYLGSVIGAILIVIGLYSVLWGKGREMEKIVNIPNTPSSTISNKDFTNMQLGEGDYKVEIEGEPKKRLLENTVTEAQQQQPNLTGKIITNPEVIDRSSFGNSS